jgi:putative colanic acid biosynthesis UDP-glucose lipid carrier transferase
MVDRLRPLPVELWLAATSLGHGVSAGNEVPHWIGGIRCIRLARPIEGWARVVKDGMDRLIAAAALVFLAPVLVLVAAAVRLDSKGPIFYRQKRLGIYGQLIEIFKFRTMHIDRCDDGSSCLTRQATRGDPRITRVGRLLRRASLDELPQLINVLKGEMSLVGPRPHAVSHDQHYARLIEHYAARQSVKPGITGWAQVNGMRGETETVEKMARRVQYDLEYIGSWSLGLDLTILFRTIFVGFVHPEAR